jgi:hypothetical protein
VKFTLLLLLLVVVVVVVVVLVLVLVLVVVVVVVVVVAVAVFINFIQHIYNYVPEAMFLVYIMLLFFCVCHKQCM